MLPSFRMPTVRRGAFVGALTLAGLAIAATASAHVTVSPTSLPQGSTAELTFKVPNEESKANTVELQLQIPTAYPIAQVLAKPVPGWTVTEHTVTLAKPLTTDDGTFTSAVDEIDWTGGSIPPGEYQDFQISVDPLPTDTTQLVFKAVQTYSNGDVVRWIDLSTGSDPDPEHPAPVLTLTPATTGAAASSTATAAAAAPAATTATTTTTTSASASTNSSSSTALGIAGLVLGAIGAVCGVAALLFVRKTRRSEAP
jgi:periplasmic copper chaperone A